MHRASIEACAHEIALGAIKYGMLSRDVNQKIVFELEAWLEEQTRASKPKGAKEVAAERQRLLRQVGTTPPWCHPPAALTV